jgi:hypothetical protein
VEVLYHGSWAPVCADNFDRGGAAVVCRQLGYLGGPATLEPADTSSLPGNVSTVAQVYSCSSDVVSVYDCVQSYIKATSCSNGAAAITCSPGGMRWHEWLVAMQTGGAAVCASQA